MTATDTEAALLAAIRANPGEDTPRRVWADWLEENAGTVACAACDGTRLVQHRPPRGATSHAMGHIEDCPICHGTGRVSDGRAELAAFIRVQVELAARDDERCRCRECQPTGQHHNGPCRSPLKPLRARERELWPAVLGAFLPRGGEKWLPMLDGPDAKLLADAQTQMPLVLVRRGLPAVVRCTLAEWMGGECKECGGQGWDCDCDPEAAGVETCYCSDYPCESCNGAKRTPGIGPRLAQRWPIERVEVTDKRPAITHIGLSGKLRFSWYGPRASGDTSDESRLPSEIFSALSHVDYDTEPAAHTALSDALIAWARGQRQSNDILS